MTSQVSTADLLTTPELLDKPKPLKFSVGQFQMMYEQGVFPEHARCELVDGEIIEMSPIGLKHAVCVGRLTNNLVLKLGKRSILWVQNPIDLGPSSLPQPDITILKYRDDFYAQALPTPVDMLLVIEVSDSSLEYDRDVKSKLYGRAGIPQMWLVDVNSKMITDFSQPSPSGYKQTYLHTQGDRLALTAFDDFLFAWDELF